jgi:hypothetical protein
VYIGIYISGRTDVTQESVRTPITEVLDHIIGYTRSRKLGGRTRTERVGSDTRRIEKKRGAIAFILALYDRWVNTGTPKGERKKETPDRGCAQRVSFQRSVVKSKQLEGGVTGIHGK